MQIILCNTGDEPNVISKRTFDSVSINGSMKNETNIIDPDILIDHNNPVNFNYCYIPEFGRYYFIKNIQLIRTNIWEIVLHVDVLMSHKDDLLKCSVLLEDSQTTGATPYIQNGLFVNTCKDKTDIISFENGFNEQGEYILITAGGIAT